MKKALVATLGLIVIVALALVIPEIHWRWASHKDETASYESYVESWPEGRHATEARARYDELGWTDAKRANTVQAFERYVKLHGEGKHVAEAKDNIESLHWKEATTVNTIRSYKGYIANYPQGKFVQQAETKASALRKDSAPYEAALRNGTEDSFKDFLADFPGHKSESQAQQVIKEISEGRDIVDLLNEKKITILSDGSGLESVSVRILRRRPYPITVHIPAGTYFISKSAPNMVATAARKVRLTSDRWGGASVPAVFVHLPKSYKIPGMKDSFTVQRLPNQSEIARLMPILEEANVPHAVCQAAVWIVTDNANFDDLGVLIRRPSDQFWGSGKREIMQYETARAMKICDKAGIDLKRKAVWRDREYLLLGLSDEKLKKWLEDKE